QTSLKWIPVDSEDDIGRHDLSLAQEGVADEILSLSSMPARNVVPDRCVLGLRCLWLCDHAKRPDSRSLPLQKEPELAVRLIAMIALQEPIDMRFRQFHRHDELTVLISLLVSVGMLVGTVVTIWMWTGV